jgi:manganese transport protein
VAEFIGAAIGLNLVFRIPLLPGGLITTALAFGILALERCGYRRFELAIVGLLGAVGLGFGYLYLVAGGEDYGQLAAGLVPRLGGHHSAEPRPGRRIIGLL